MAGIRFKNRYSEQRQKDEFYTECDQTQVTDQSQLCGASIVEMAKRFGIDAIIAKAEKTVLDNEKIQDQLYGHDYTKMFKSSDERLNVKNKLTNLFENIPARIRKEYFNDSIANFIDAYVTNDEKKLTQLNKLGIVSNSQLEKVVEFNINNMKEKQEAEIRKNFINALEKQKEGLYETYKTTGNITIDNNNDNAENS